MRRFVVVAALLVQLLGAWCLCAQEPTKPTQHDLDYLLTVIDHQRQSLETLEKRVEELNARLKAVEEKLERENQSVGQRAVPPGLDVWRHEIKKGMSYDQVRQLLGEPVRIENQGSFDETWFYSRSRDSGYVWFNESKVFSWQEPSQ